MVADGGATSLRMGLVAGSSDESSGVTPSVARRVEVPGFQWTRGEDPVQQQCGRLVAGWEALGRPGPVEVIAFGLAGGAADEDGRRRLAAEVAVRLGARRVYATGDDVTTHLGVLGGQPGVVVAAGTGTLCLAVSPDGRLHNVDGLGYLFGDLGSGFALGLAGVRGALAAREGRGPPTRLLTPLIERIGEPLLEEIRKWYASPTLVAEVADFATEVLAAAHDDEVAQALCSGAGNDLASVVAAAAHRAFPEAGPAGVPVSWSGSVLRSSRAVFDPFVAALTARCPEALPSQPCGDSMAGALRLAAGSEVPHLAGVVRHEAS